MNKRWLLAILTASITVLCILKSHELRALKPYFKHECVPKLQSFQEARQKVKKRDLEYLKLWESILTGRSAPLSKMIKERYKTLGLNHLFTPSGFHLSAVLFPFMKVASSKFQLWILILIGIGLLFTPGLIALKRMVVIKIHQKILGIHLGFLISLAVDILFGSFQENTLSFTYSFLFLGIIYSGLEGLGLIIWFFIGQILIAYFQNSDVSFLVLFLSPILNLGFSILMPILFCLSFPLWDWQLQFGIFLVKNLQGLVDHFSKITLLFPFIEIHIVSLLFITLFLFQRWKMALITLVFMSSSLNIDRTKTPGSSAYEFVPNGIFIKSVVKDDDATIYFKNGKCNLKLIRGFWWQNCSPLKRSNRIKQTKKLSYLSLNTQTSFLRG